MANAIPPPTGDESVVSTDGPEPSHDLARRIRNVTMASRLTVEFVRGIAGRSPELAAAVLSDVEQRLTRWVYVQLHQEPSRMTPVQWVAALKQVAAMARSQLGPVGSTVGRVIDDAVPHFDRLRAIDSATIARRMRLALSAVGETAKDGSGDETATSVTTGEPIGIGENPE